MDPKEVLKKYAEIRFDKNFSKVEKLYNHDLSYMSSLTFIKFEILNCLILEFNNASITLTNHFVERMLKLSLILLETKNITLSEPDKYSKKVNHLHQQYDHLYLHETLNHNKKKKLISEEEYKFLSNDGKMFRDSYSHAQIGKINIKQPNNFSGQMFSISDVKKKLTKGESNFTTRKIEIPSISPSVAQLYQNISAEKNALIYFTKVYEILINIEKRLEEI
ncbi:hypothetical protein [Flavobacterium sp.]|uniref:hypothetical protein n=1 Tax=Flavobacterium sp. TaxID=239 RepID=UPI003F698ED3